MTTPYEVILATTYREGVRTLRRNLDTGQMPVLQFMQKHPGIVYTADFMAGEMSLVRSDENLKSLGKSMATLCAKHMIERVGSGKYLYRHMPEPRKPVAAPVAGSLYEAIGVRKSTGNVIVKDDSDNLYELHEL